MMMIHGRAYCRALCSSRLVDIARDMIQCAHPTLINYCDLRHSNIFLPLPVLLKGKPKQRGREMPGFTAWLVWLEHLSHMPLHRCNFLLFETANYLQYVGTICIEFLKRVQQEWYRHGFWTILQQHSRAPWAPRWGRGGWPSINLVESVRGTVSSRSS